MAILVNLHLRLVLPGRLRLPRPAMRSENGMRWSSRQITCSRGKRRPSPQDHKCDVKGDIEAGDQIRDIAEKELQKHLQDIGREAEADPNGTYLTTSRLSRCVSLGNSRHSFANGSRSKQPSLIRTTWTVRKTWHGRCVESLLTG
jgi:hypothetical protein